MDQREQTAERELRYEGFVGLLARHEQAIRRFVRSLMPSRDGVDDVVQETALECWKKFATFTSEGDASGDEFLRWAFVIARFKVLGWQRDATRDRLVFRDSVIERLADAAIEQCGQRDAERRAIATCLAELPEHQRRLVLSVYSPGQSIADIAAETGEKARALYSRVNALRKLLFACVGRRLSEEAARA